MQRADCLSHGNSLEPLGADLEGQVDAIEEGKSEALGLRGVGKEWVSVRKRGESIWENPLESPHCQPGRYFEI